jgi:hypothetical protein
VVALQLEGVRRGHALDEGSGRRACSRPAAAEAARAVSPATSAATGSHPTRRGARHPGPQEPARDRRREHQPEPCDHHRTHPTAPFPPPYRHRRGLHTGQRPRRCSIVGPAPTTAHTSPGSIGGRRREHLPARRARRGRRPRGGCPRTPPSPRARSKSTRPANRSRSPASARIGGHDVEPGLDRDDPAGLERQVQPQEARPELVRAAHPRRVGGPVAEVLEVVHVEAQEVAHAVGGRTPRGRRRRRGRRPRRGGGPRPPATAPGPGTRRCGPRGRAPRAHTG